MKRFVSDYSLSESEQATINKICALANGVPLAIELAASWLNSLTLTEIASELQDSIDFLSHNLADVPAHQRSIRATFEYTWNLLSPPEQTALAKLAIFKGGCTRHAAQHITEANLHILSSLVDKSILRHDAQDGRYTMHELQREFVTEKMHTLYDLQPLQQRHAQYYSNMLRQNHDALYSTNLPEVLDTITIDIHNIQQAWNWATQHQKWSIIDDASHPLGRYYQVMGLIQDGVEVFETTLQDIDAGSDHKLLMAHIYQEYTALLAESGELQQAIEFSQNLIELAQSLNQTPLIITGYLNWSKALWYEGDVNSAKQYLEKAMTLAEGIRSVEVHYSRPGDYANASHDCPAFGRSRKRPSILRSVFI